jgi:lycopene cyclase domain-containing protein
MERWTYLLQILGLAVPVILLQWLIAGRTLRRNELAITVPTLVVGTAFLLAEFLAIRLDLWTFDPIKRLGPALLGVPVERILFFYVVALLFAQTYILLLPRWLKR